MTAITLFSSSGLKIIFFIQTVRKILVVNLYLMVSWGLSPTSTFIFFHAMFINVCNMLACLLKDCLYICNWYSTSSLVGCYSVQTCSLVFDIFLLTVTLLLVTSESLFSAQCSCTLKASTTCIYFCDKAWYTVKIHIHLRVAKSYIIPSQGI